MRNLVVATVLLALCGTSLAGPTYPTTYYWQVGSEVLAVDVVAQVRLIDVPGNAPGGPYIVQVVDGDLGGYSGPAWCLESEISFAPGKTYLASIDRKAFSGGVPGIAGDPLSKTTENIYEAHRSDVAGSAAVSAAIWEAEDEAGGAANAVYAAAGGPGNDDTAASDRVAVLNLWEAITVATTGKPMVDDIQSHVIGVPAPGAVLLGGLGTGLVGFLRRRFMA